MATWVPQFKLYNSAGTGLLYTFHAVNYTNAPQTVESFVEITSLRSKGSVVIDGGEAVWDLELRFTLLGDDYEDITSQIETLENTIAFNTPYVLRIDKTNSTYFEYPVKRLTSFIYDENLRTDFQKVVARFRVNCW